jgi:ankyrin repeat protein
MNTVNGYDETPLHLACEEGQFEEAKLLLEKGAKIDAKDTSGRTPLHRACENGHLEVTKWLVEKGANIHAVTKKDWTPLHYACRNGDLEVARLLVEKGASITVKNSDGNIPWKLAYMCGFGDNFLELKRKLIYFKVGSLYQTTQSL